MIWFLGISAVICAGLACRLAMKLYDLRVKKDAEITRLSETIKRDTADINILRARLKDAMKNDHRDAKGQYAEAE